MNEEQNINEPQSPAFLQGAVMRRAGEYIGIKAPNGKLLSSITVGKTEISLPNIPNEYWVLDFDAENSDLESAS